MRRHALYGNYISGEGVKASRFQAKGFRRGQSARMAPIVASTMAAMAEAVSFPLKIISVMIRPGTRVNRPVQDTTPKS
jgi:hypothetical protein